MPSGRVQLADPFRRLSLRLLERLEHDGWSVVMSKWNIGESTGSRDVGVFALTRPERAPAETMR